MLHSFKETILSSALPLLSPVSHIQCVFQSWGPELDQTQDKISEFLEELETFVTSLGDARDNMSGHVTLAESEYDSMINDKRSPADYQTIGMYCYFP